VDPRRLLGVGPRATRSEVRSAQRRLRAQVGQGSGGSAALAALVDAAADVVLAGADPAGLAAGLDPLRLLGVAPDASRDTIAAAYRRVARVAHPDGGGTDELFRVVEGARRDALEPPLTRRRRASGPRWAPPPPPPPRGPYRAPPPDQRHVVATWRAVRDLAFFGAVLAFAGFVVAGAFLLGTRPGTVAAVVLVVAVVGRAPFLRPAVDGALRAVIVLAGSRVRVPDAVAPERFLEHTCLDAPVGRVAEDVLYGAYVRWCGGRGRPVAPWVFVERLRTLGLLLVKPSSWDPGLWVGITLPRR
jgi:hypothetical protein